jgi:hypothetical protein
MPFQSLSPIITVNSTAPADYPNYPNLNNFSAYPNYSNLNYSSYPNYSNYSNLNYPNVNFPNFLNSVMNPSSSAFQYHDTGVEDSALSNHKTNKHMRYRFLDDSLIHDNKDILSMLKVDGDTVKPTSEKEEGTIGSSEDVKKKIDYIGTEILDTKKNMKILKEIIDKNEHLRFYQLPKNLDYVFSTQAKYVKSKIRELRNNSH